MSKIKSMFAFLLFIFFANGAFAQCTTLSFTKKMDAINVVLSNDCLYSINYKVTLELLLPNENSWIQICENIKLKNELSEQYSSPLVPLRGKSQVGILFKIKQKSLLKDKRNLFRFKAIILEDKANGKKINIYSKEFNSLSE